MCIINIIFSAVQNLTETKFLDVYRGEQVNLQCPFNLGNLHTTISPYQICWKDYYSCSGNHCCLTTNPFVTITDRNLTILETVHDQEFSCSLYLKRCIDCPIAMYGNATFIIHVFGECNNFLQTRYSVCISKTYSFQMIVLITIAIKHHSIIWNLVCS